MLGFHHFISRLFARRPVRRDRLDISRRQAGDLKKKLLAQIEPRDEQDHAFLLDKKIRTKPSARPVDMMDWLAVVAFELTLLPKVLPHVAWYEAARARLARARQLPQLFLLRRATAFVAFLVVTLGVAGVSLMSSSSATLAGVAVLDITDGIVKVRAADATFFVTVSDGSQIRVGDTIRVEQNGAASLAFADLSEMHLAEGTEITITDSEPVSAMPIIRDDESSTRVALMSGSVETEVTQSDTAVSFEIETSTGLIQANKSKFAVSIDTQTGATEVITSEDTVAVRNMTETTSTELLAGERAVLGGTAVIVDEAPAAAGTDIVQLATQIDILTTRSFDALVLAQHSQSKTAKKAMQMIHAELAQLSRSLSIEFVAGQEAAALRIWLVSAFAGADELPAMTANLSLISQLETITNHYLVDPTLRRGAPEFDIATRDRYRPTPELRKLHAALSARNLAALDIQPAVSQLIDTVIAAYRRDILDRDSEAWLTGLLAGMDQQPLYLPAMQPLAAELPIAHQDMIQPEEVAMQERLSGYIGG